MELYNSTLYDYQAIINDVSYDLKSRSSIFFDCENNASVDKIKLSYNDWSLRDQVEIKACYADSNIFDENILCQALKRLGKNIKCFIRLFQMRFLSA